jgi:hypothetical protein
MVHATGAFPTTEPGGLQITDTNSALSVLTGLDDPTMNGIWGIATGIGAIAAIGLAWITHSIIPVGIYLFSLVFWTAYLNAWSVISYGGFLDSSPGPEFLLIATIGILFIFIAAIVGMLTGSG